MNSTTYDRCPVNNHADYIGDDEQMTTSLDDEIDDSPVGQDDMYTVVSFGGAYSF